MSDELYDDIDAARARVDAQIAAAEQRRAAVHRLANEVGQLTATAQSPRGEVSATAQPGGKVTAVRVTEEGLSLSADALSRVLTETVAQAQHSAAMTAVDRSSELLGADSPFVQNLRLQANEAFPGAGSDGIRLG
jgi:DNA-binding protein YbaB